MKRGGGGPPTGAAPQDLLRRKSRWSATLSVMVMRVSPDRSCSDRRHGPQEGAAAVASPARVSSPRQPVVTVGGAGRAERGRRARPPCVSRDPFQPT